MAADIISVFCTLEQRTVGRLEHNGFWWPLTRCVDCQIGAGLGSIHCSLKRSCRVNGNSKKFMLQWCYLMEAQRVSRSVVNFSSRSLLKEKQPQKQKNLNVSELVVWPVLSAVAFFVLMRPIREESVADDCLNTIHWVRTSSGLSLNWALTLLGNSMLYNRQ